MGKNKKSYKIYNFNIKKKTFDLLISIEIILWIMLCNQIFIYKLFYFNWYFTLNLVIQNELLLSVLKGFRSY